jgi:hypothetical protein
MDDRPLVTVDHRFIRNKGPVRWSHTTTALFLFRHPATKRRMRQTLRVAALNPEYLVRPALSFQRRAATPYGPPNIHTSRALRHLVEWSSSR